MRLASYETLFAKRIDPQRDSAPAPCTAWDRCRAQYFATLQLAVESNWKWVEAAAGEGLHPMADSIGDHPAESGLHNCTAGSTRCSTTQSRHVGCTDIG
jgi:hypothetical protein